MDKIRTTPDIEEAYKEAETAWSEYKTVRQEVIKTSQSIEEGDPIHPLATNQFSKEIKRVQVIDNEIKIFEPDDPHVTGIFTRNEKDQGQKEHA